MDIDALLKKKSWKGEEVGRALLYSLAADYGGGSTGLLAQGDLDIMVASLESERDKWDYTCCALLYKGLSAARNWADACLLQLNSGNMQCRMLLNSIETDQRLRIALCSIPALITDKQYNSHLKALKTDRAANTADHNQLLWAAFAFYSGQFARRKPDTPENIKTLLAELTALELNWLFAKDPWERDEADTETFNQRYPELYAALEQDLAAQPLPKPEEGSNPPRYTWERLAEAKIYLYPRMLREFGAHALIEGNDIRMPEDYYLRHKNFQHVRARNGLAVMRVQPVEDMGLSYIPAIRQADAVLGRQDELAYMLSDDNHLETVRVAREEFLWQNARWLLAFNKITGMIADIFKVPELRSMTIPEQDILGPCDAVQQQIKDIAEGFKDTERSASTKRWDFALVFPKYNADPLALHEGACKIVDENLRGAKKGKHFPADITIMIGDMGRPEIPLEPLPAPGPTPNRYKDLEPLAERLVDIKLKAAEIQALVMADMEQQALQTDIEEGENG